MSVSVPFLNYDRMAAIAATFLAAFPGYDEPPINIEYLLEASGIIIVPMVNLSRNFGIDGFLSADLKHIYVDERQYTHSSSFRFRFTLAHEAAHLQAHKSILQSLNIKEPSDSDGGMRGLTQEAYNDLEFQANTIAGMILVPEHYLRMQIEKLAEVLSTFSSIDEKIERASELLYKKYQVSRDVVAIRIRNEEFID